MTRFEIMLGKKHDELKDKKAQEKKIHIQLKELTKEIRKLRVEIKELEKKNSAFIKNGK
jgi:septal ring factor EnvC (AmiA/AmiB activator)